MFASFAAASPFVDYPGYEGTPLDRVTAYLKDPRDMEQFLQETQGKFQIEKTGGAVTSFGLERSDITLEEYREKFEEQPFYQLTSDRELYDMVGKPLEQTRDLMGLFLAALLTQEVRYNALMEEIDTLEAAGKVFVVRPHDPIEIGRFEKNTDKLLDLYNRGRREMRGQLNALRDYLMQ